MLHPQHRNTLFLLANTGLAAAAGLGFWLVVTRLLRLPAADVGLGYALVALATTAAVLAKGGLDTALLRHLGAASTLEAGRTLRFATLLGAGLGAACCLALALPAQAQAVLPGVGPVQWALVALLGFLMLWTWLQDAAFLAEADARATTRRNALAAALRIGLPFLLLGLADAILLSWVLSLAAAGLFGWLLRRRLPRRDGGAVPRQAFLASAARNGAGNAAEILPGLLLAPLVLAVDGAEAAAYFGIAWTAASMLFLAVLAIGRSALAQLVRAPEPDAHAAILRRGVRQALLFVVPGAVAGILLARPLLGLFGPAYAAAGALPFAILCASAVALVPTALWLAVLRARELTLPLVLLPSALLVSVLVAAAALAPLGLWGVALGWAAANLPFGAWSAWRLGRESRPHGTPDHGPAGVMPPALAVGGRADVE